MLSQTEAVYQTGDGEDPQTTGKLVHSHREDEVKETVSERFYTGPEEF